jgi:hypothetical protein
MRGMDSFLFESVEARQKTGGGCLDAHGFDERRRAFQRDFRASENLVGLRQRKTGVARFDAL